MKPKKKQKGCKSWIAPEHSRMALGMRRDKNCNLIVDQLPEVMRPKKARKGI